ncbi:MAG: 30S ribosomal protein S12 methylthiotransferase RimO [Gammaproteobacteria bacterium]
MPDAPKVGFVSLGCPKALVDSERIITNLRAEGYDIASAYDSADLVVVNTCGFIDSAVEESLDAIGEALNENGKVVVTGCLGAREQIIRDRFPEVLSITGAHAYEEVMGAVHENLPQPHDPLTSLVPAGGIKLTPRHYAYLKISEGCNHRCSFCIIPSLRGDLVSRPVDDVLREARGLVEAGVNELLVISQDTSAYGVDIKYRPGLWDGRAVKARMTDLSKALGELGAWVRLHYVYPYPHVDEIIPLMEEGYVLPYLDIPFQHASPTVLKAMKRPASSTNVLERLGRWRERIPELAIRSTFIVGFPGETEADFQQLLDFLEQARLDRVGCFTYSPVDGAAANDLPDAVPAEVAEERYQRFMEVQARISAEKLAARVGGLETVIVDDFTEGEQGRVAIARSFADAPEVDGNVFIEEPEGLAIGEFVEVEITASDDHDLTALPA